MSDVVEDEEATLDDVVAAALADKHLAERDKIVAETEHERIAAKLAQIELDRVRKEYDFALASDKEHRIYRFTGTVEQDSVHVCEEHLSRWSRLDGRKPKPMGLVINSPGGYASQGMDLFDFLLGLQDKGHEITITVRGVAASMGGILVQAASPGRRFMGREAYLLLHSPSTVVGGSLGEIQDELEYLSMLNERMLDIFADRCQSSAAAECLTRDQLKQAVNRKDRWFSSDEALKGGLVDGIR